MEHFAYSFLVSMLHSLWQAAFLWLLLRFNITVFTRQAPLLKRNLILAFLSSQACLTAITFYLVYSGTYLSGLIDPAIFYSQVNTATIQSWSVSIFLIYTAAILIKSVYLVSSWQRFKRTQRLSMQKPPIQLRLFTHAKAMEFGLKRKVGLWLSEKVTTPVTYGFLKPVILLPVALVNQLTIKEAEALIIHELSHIKNKDFLWNWLVVAMETIYCFNPFIYYIARQLKLEREKSCDVQVIDFQYPPLLYAEALLKTAKTRQATLSLQIGAIKGNQELLKRIHFFSNQANFNFRKQGNAISFLIIPLILTLNLLVVSQILNQKIDSKVESATYQVINKITPGEKMKVFVAKGVPEPTEDKDVQEQLTGKKTTQSLQKKSNPASEIKTAEEESFYSTDEHPTVYPVTNVLPLKKETKEVLIQETNSDGETITIALEAELSNGEWVMQPLWILSETRNNIDSTIKSGKDSARKKIAAVQ
jgi:bla regulator protein blaR1